MSRCESERFRASGSLLRSSRASEKVEINNMPPKSEAIRRARLAKGTNRQPQADLERVTRGYKGGEEMPLGPFAVIMGAYGLTMAGFFVVSKLTGRKPPEKVALG